MIKAVIIDDEPRARDILGKHLEKSFSKRVKVVAEADDVQSGIQVIKETKPDLVFLDINLTTGSGFELLNQLRDYEFEVIFVTAYDSYAVKAFQFSAFGYLMKPIRPQELTDVINRVEDYINVRKDDLQMRLKILVENYGDDRSIKKLVISSQKGFQVSNIEDIVRLEGDGNYTRFIFTDGTRDMTSKRIGEYEELLNDFGFFRIHQSTIVNLRHVVGYSKDSGDMVKMCDGESFKLSRYRKQGFLKRFL